MAAAAAPSPAAEAVPVPLPTTLPARSMTDFGIDMLAGGIAGKSLASCSVGSLWVAELASTCGLVQGQSDIARLLPDDVDGMFFLLLILFDALSYLQELLTRLRSLPSSG